MVSGQRGPLDLGSRIPGPWRKSLTAVLVLVAWAVALAQLLLVVRAWQIAGDEIGLRHPREPALTQLSVMAEVMSWLTLQGGSLDVAVGAGAATIAFALLGQPAAAAIGIGWRRAAWTATIVVAVVSLATALVGIFVQANWVIVINDSTTRSFFGEPDTAVGLARLLGVLADGLLWAAALIVGLLWRPGVVGLRWFEEEDDAVAEGAAAGGDVGANVGDDLADHLDRQVTRSAPPSNAYTRPVTADPAPGPRLEADGSSDSGYDEFRFRR